MENDTYLLAGQLKLNRMGYGGMRLTGPGVFGDISDRNDALKLLQTAVEMGVNFIDTADSYGPNTNEVLIADALAPYGRNLFIATKGGLERPGPNIWIPNGKPDYIKKTIDGSLKRLKLEKIDLWQLHRVDPEVPIEETLGPVVEAVKAGKIRYVGLSEVDIDQIERAKKIIPIASVQNLFNLTERKWEHVLEYTRQNNMAFIPWYPLAAGPDKMSGALETIASKHEATKAQVALAWLLKRAENILLIPGTSSIKHLKENIESKKIRLSDSEFQELSDTIKLD